jgi:hypothetical protein
MHKISEADSPLRLLTTDTRTDDDYTYVIYFNCGQLSCTQYAHFRSQIVKAKLGPPTIELLLGTDDNQTVLFTLSIEVPQHFPSSVWPYLT